MKNEYLKNNKHIFMQRKIVKARLRVEREFLKTRVSVLLL